jgi:hypothetical protein
MFSMCCITENIRKGTGGASIRFGVNMGGLKDRSGNEPAGHYTFFYGNENENHHLDTSFFYIRNLTNYREGTVS